MRNERPAVDPGRPYHFFGRLRHPAGKDRLTSHRTATVGDAIGSGYCVRLAERMDHTPNRNGDPKLYRLVRAAQDALHLLWVEHHYQSRGHGVGRPPTDGS
jgi:hypothetical protein